MQKPKNLLQIRGFLGAVNHCQCMWPQCAHNLAPISSELGMKTFCESTYGTRWPPCLPNQNNPFHIYTDAPSYQMGAYIVQDNKHVTFWPHKLNNTQLLDCWQQKTPFYCHGFNIVLYSAPRSCASYPYLSPQHYHKQYNT